MTAARLALVALAACGGPRLPAEPASTGALTCLSSDQLLDREQAVAAANRAALTRALAEASLTEARFDVDSFAIGDDLAGDAFGWQVVEATGRRDLLSPPTYDVCGAGHPWHLALDGRGSVFVLVLQVRPTTRHDLAVCGCQSDVPITCGGAAVQQVRWRWALPAGLAFAGPLSLVVDDESSHRTYAGRGDGRPCPPPTAPP